MNSLFPRNQEADSPRHIYQVTELTRLICSTLEEQFGPLQIEGEISNFRKQSSGHLYFTLKDATSQIASVFFRGDQVKMKFTPRDGQLVRIIGELTVYERKGQYQVRVRHIEAAGKGALLEQLEERKRKLATEGLFDPKRKKAIPRLPLKIGIVTSPTGAAIRDVLQVATRRFPNLHILLAPVKVQGEDAAKQIAKAIHFLDLRGDMDVLIVGRGGGSLEDLWCFNEEVVVRAITEATVPIITGIGHEIDTTLSDLAADVRAATPSAAAEQAVRPLEDWSEELRGYSRRLYHLLEQQLQAMKLRVSTAAGSYVFREPKNIVLQHRQNMESQSTNMRQILSSRLQQHHQLLDESALLITHRMGVRTDRRRQDLVRLEAQLRALSPQAVLDRGYSITRNAQGEIIRNAIRATPGETIFSRLAKGTLEATITQATTEDSHDK